jgi:hypothetical protein
MSQTKAPETFGEIIAHTGDLSRAYGEALAADIPADRFAEKPAPTMNNPAWVYGHLIIYPNRVGALIGEGDLIELPGTYEGLFAPGTPCEDDASKYPGKDELMRLYSDGYAKAAAAVRDADPQTFAQEMPIERMRERFPTVGTGVAFLLNNHLMMHLGQISSWRRAIGLPSVF